MNKQSPSSKTPKILLLCFIVLLSFSACGPNIVTLDSSCGASGFYETDSGPLHWPDGSTIHMAFDPSFPNEKRSDVLAASDTFNDHLLRSQIHVHSSNMPTSSQLRNTSIENTMEDNFNGIYWIKDSAWPFHDSNPNAIAVVHFRFRSSQLIETDMYFRESHFQSFASKEENSSHNKPLFAMPRLLSGFNKLKNLAAAYSEVSSPRLYNTALHEMGHVMGLCHSNDRESMMFPGIQAHQQHTASQNIPKSDRETLSLVYDVR